MSKGYEKHHHRMGELNKYGKDLVRRAKSGCELCGEHHGHFLIYEVDPVPETPDFEHCIHICEECHYQINHPKKMDINHWHGLSTTAWSDVPAIQVMAIMMLRRMRDEEEWAKSLLEQLYISPETEKWLEEIEKTNFR